MQKNENKIPQDNVFNSFSATFTSVTGPFSAVFSFKNLNNVSAWRKERKQLKTVDTNLELFSYLLNTGVFVWIQRSDYSAASLSVFSYS